MRNATMGTTTKQLGNGDDRDNGKQDLTRIANGGDGHKNHKDNGPDGKNGEYSKDREDQEWGGKASTTQEDPQQGQERWATDDDPGAAGKGKGEARMRRTHAPLAALLESEATRLFIFSSCPPLP